MIKYYLFGLILCCYQFTLFAQKNKVDSLENILKNAKHDTTRLRLYIALGDACDITDNLKYAEPAVKLTEKLLSQTLNVKEKRNISKQKAIVCNYFIAYFDNKGDTAKRMEYVNKQLSIFKDIQDTLSYSFAMMYLSIYYRNQGNFSQAIACCQKLLSESEKMHYKRGIAIALFQMGAMYADQGDTALALENYQKDLTIAYQLNDKNDLAHVYYFMGVLYSQIHNVSKALGCFQKTISLYEELKDKRRLSDTYGAIGAMYNENKNFTNSLLFYQKALSMTEELNNKELVKYYLDCIGQVYKWQGDLVKSLDYHFKALKMAKELHSESDIVGSYHCLAQAYFYQGNFKLAKEYNDHVLAAMKTVSALSIICETEQAASQIDSALGNGNGAFEHYKQYIILRDKLKSDEVLKAAAKEKFQNESDRQKAAAKLEQDKKDAVTKMIIWSVVGGLFIVIVFAGIIFRSLRVTRKQKGIIEEQKQRVDEANEELNQQNEEIAAQRDIVIQQKEHIEDIHKGVTDSINYAKRLQTSALPNLKLLDDYFSDLFLLFKPKDVVSGDFYWFARVEDRIVVTVADCTGHGVPGAFMSMLGMSLLKEIVVKEYMTQPDIILKRLRKEIIKALGQTGEYGEQKDGMDISLCSINTDSLEMQWSGANNPCLIIRSGELIELKADKMPIAIYDKMDKFALHEMSLQKGDSIYLSSDGYADQFGGPDNKKFMSLRFKELLLTISTKPMNEQKNILDKTLEEWRIGHEAENEQTDDITVLGLKFS